jgi:hypothetical protein
VEVAPHEGPVDALDNLEHVMVVAPVDADVDEAEQVGQEPDSSVYQVGRKSFVFFRSPRPDATDPETG